MSALSGICMTSEAMPLGDGLTVSFTMTGGKLDVDWSPRVPVGRKGRKYLPAYRLARDEFLRRVGLRTGLTVGVIEI